MQAVYCAESELTGKLEAATVCPELRSEVDGKLICEGIADVDLLAMHDFGVQHDGRIMPLELLSEDRTEQYEPRKLVPGARRMVEQAKDKMLRKFALQQRKDNAKKFRADNLKAHAERIEANKHRWQEIPQTDEDVQAVIAEDTPFILNLIKMLSKSK